MEISSMISSVSVGVAIIATLILGIVVFLSNRKSVTNKAFLFLSLIIVIWSFLNYLSYQFNSPELVLWILRLVIFFAVWFAFSVFALFYVSPYEKINFPKWYKFILSPLAVLVSCLTLTPAVFKGIKILAPIGQASVMDVAPGIAVFGLSVIGLVLSGFILLIRKILNKKGAERRQLVLLLIGALTFVIFVLIFNFILPAFFDNPSFIPLSAIFTFPFIAFTSYAILKHGLFNVKVIATQLLVFVIWIVTSVGLFLAESTSVRLLDGAVLFFTIIAGIALIKSVKKEVKQREDIEKLAEDLGVANEKLKGLDKLKSEFLSLASHQLRSPLTAIKGYTSMLAEGSYGKLEEKQKEVIGNVLVSTQSLISMVEDFLNVSKIEQGGMQYAFEPTPLAKLVSDLFAEMKITAQNNGLDFTLTMDPGDAFTINADAGKLRQVFLNLIDNSIKYTSNGFVHLSLARNKNKNTVTFSVEDTGAGISAEEKEKLFEKFKRGDGQKLNSGGSGLGLYLAREIVKAHNGRILVESEGKGKGSCFVVELGAGDNVPSI